MYETPILTETFGLARINAFLKEPYEAIAKRDLLNTLIPIKFEKNTLINSFLDANRMSKIVTKIKTTEQASLGFISELSTIDLLSKYQNINSIFVLSDKLKNASPEALEKSLQSTNQRMGDFYVDLTNQSKYFDIKHGNMLITNNNSVQEFSQENILNKSIDERTYIKVSKELFQRYCDGPLLNKTIKDNILGIIDILESNLPFVEKLHKKNDIIFNMYQKFDIPGFHPSLHFIKSHSSGNTIDSEMPLKEKLKPNVQKFLTKILQQNFLLICINLNGQFLKKI